MADAGDQRRKRQAIDTSPRTRFAPPRPVVRASLPPTIETLWAAFAKAADALSPLTWGKLDTISKPAADAIAKSDVPEGAKRTIAFRAEAVATKALKSGDPDALGRAKALCSFKAALGMAAGAGCTKLARGGG